MLATLLGRHRCETFAGLDAPAARSRHRVKTFFLRGHGSKRVELLCAQAGGLARDSPHYLNLAFGADPGGLPFRCWYSRISSIIGCRHVAAVFPNTLCIWVSRDRVESSHIADERQIYFFLPMAHRLRSFIQATLATKGHKDRRGRRSRWNQSAVVKIFSETHTFSMRSL
jgi:hypothetical protein